MPTFIPTNYHQDLLLAINLEEQLQQGTFEFALHYLIEHKLDLSVFYPRYKNDEQGRPAYDPRVLLKIVLFAYSRGITSSREIDWCCRNNIIFKALACNHEPHFTTIAHFISSKPSDIEAIFEQVLLVCDQQGLLGHELFAIDGCKMASDAAKTHSGTFKELGEKRDKIKRLIKHHMSEHARCDQHDDEGAAKAQRHQQTIDTLNKQHDKIVNFLDNNTPRIGSGKTQREVKSNITDNESAKMTTSKGTIQGFNSVTSADKKRQVIIDAQVVGSGQEHQVLQPVLNAIKARYQRLGFSQNLYQDGIIVTADTGYANEDNMQYLHDNAINAYIPDNQFRSRDPKFSDQKQKYGKRHQDKKSTAPKRFTQADFLFDPKRLTCYCPEGQRMHINSQSQDKHGNEKVFFEGPMSQCRVCDKKHHCMQNPSSADTRDGHGRQVSFIIKKNNRTLNYTDWMKQRVDSDQGKHIYSHRMSVIEPVFANITSNKGLKRFSLRGKAKVQGQWQLYCLVHNIEKLNNYGHLGR